jgi:UDP-N-acetylmuramate dehydrogenase
VLIASKGQAPVQVSAAELKFAYRTSALKQALAEGATVPLVLQAAFRLQPGDPTQMAATASTYLERRRSTQPVEPSAGSVFRNPPGDYAGRLIEDCGLKGQQFGGAQISLRHANFIINTGPASATDVRTLIDLVQSRVRESFGISLMPEILYLGEF